jgi:putative cation transport ATPase
LSELPQDLLFKKNSRAHGGLARRFYVRKYKLRVEGVMCRVFFTGGIVIKNKKDMKTSKFKTTAKCGGCVAKIGETLDKVVARDQWNIDLSTPDRVLTITSDLSDDRVIELVKEAGFKAEKLG